MEDNSDMPSPTQEFCLKWNNFQASLVTAIDGFKNDLEFVDVTIACEGRLLKAHKMLLSACSIFFRDIFKDVTQHQHPVIILPGEVKFHDLEKILTFIYQGEVNVHQENLPRFLKTAEMLKIRGLAEDNEKRTLRSTVSPKAVSKNGNSASKRRKIYDGQSTSGNELFKTVDDCSRPLIGDAESDTEMVPVKQEMVELKEIDFESTDAESFIAEALLKEVAPTPSSSSCLQAQSSAPPPPGPLMPSYIPPAQIKNQDGMSRSSPRPVGGLIRRFMEECLQLPDPTPLLATYNGLEGTPHFQLLRSVAKEWSYCRNATQNYSSLGGSSKRQRATSRLIETFEKIDSLRAQLAQSLHDIIVVEVETPGSVGKVCKAEQTHSLQQQQQPSQQGDDTAGNSSEQNSDPIILDVEGVSALQQQSFFTSTNVMKQLRKLYFDQSRRLAVRISQLKKGRQQSNERLQRHQLQQNLLQQTLHQFQQQQMQHQIGGSQGQPQLNSDGSLNLHSQAQMAMHLHQPWSD